MITLMRLKELKEIRIQLKRLADLYEADLADRQVYVREPARPKIDEEKDVYFGYVNEQLDAVQEELDRIRAEEHRAKTEEEQTL